MTIINLDLIDPNPHRDLIRNPPLPAQIKTLIASIKRNEWGENVIVREHPTEPGRYQQAYGHTRLAALRELKLVKAEFIVKPLTEWGMLCWMIDENESQRTLTPELILENVEAGIKFLEPIVQASETIEDFALAVGISPAIRLYKPLKLLRIL